MNRRWTGLTWSYLYDALCSGAERACSGGVVAGGGLAIVLNIERLVILAASGAGVVGCASAGLLAGSAALAVLATNPAATSDSVARTVRRYCLNSLHDGQPQSYLRNAGVSRNCIAPYNADHARPGSRPCTAQRYIFIQPISRRQRCPALFLDLP